MINESSQHGCLHDVSWYVGVVIRGCPYADTYGKQSGTEEQAKFASVLVFLL